MNRIRPVLLALSGFASLTYQVVWVRLLGLSLGSTSESTSTVLAAFFLGLGLGSYGARMLRKRWKRPLLVYAALELVIATVGALLLPVLLSWSEWLAAIAHDSVPLKLLVTMALLVVPTFCMGATLPVLAEMSAPSKEQPSTRLGAELGSLYFWNTVGAVFGAVLTGFLFVPTFGLDGTVVIAVTANVFAAILAIRFTSAESHESFSIDAPKATPGKPFVLLVIAWTGAASIAAEVAWTKYLAIFVGSTLYGFSTILTAFLAGLSVGAHWMRRRLERHSWQTPALVIGLVILAASLLATRSALELAPQLLRLLNDRALAPSHIALLKLVVTFALIFPTTFAFGALLPLTLCSYCQDATRSNERLGPALAVNTFAGIVGAVGAGYWILPSYGTDSLLYFLALGTSALPLAFYVESTKLLRFVIAASPLIVGAVGLALPELEYRAMLDAVEYDADSETWGDPEYLFLRESRTGVISVVTFDGQSAKLQNNGLNESWFDLEDPNSGLTAETLLGALPCLLHPTAKSAFCVGYGGGMTAHALTQTELEQIDIVELDAAVIDAVRTVLGANTTRLSDPRLSIEVGDARHALLTTSERYDIIISQPSHPWRAGAASLFSSRFFDLTRSRLERGGLFTAWLNLFEMDPMTLRSILRSFFDVYPHGAIFAEFGTEDLLLVGSESPIRFDPERIALQLDEGRIGRLLADHEVHEPNDLFLYYALSRSESLALAGPGPRNTDTNLLTEVRLARFDPEAFKHPSDLLMRHVRYDLSKLLPEIEDQKTAIRHLAERFVNLEWFEDAERAIARLEELEVPAAKELRQRVEDASHED